MNQAQVKYLRQRAEQIYVDKQRKIKDEFTQPAVTLTTSERLQALRDGRFEYLADINKDIPPHQFFYNFRFTDETPQVMKDGYNTALENLMYEYRKLMDELILGDNEEALKLLKAFEVG